MSNTNNAFHNLNYKYLVIENENRLTKLYNFVPKLEIS